MGPSLVLDRLLELLLVPSIALLGHHPVGALLLVAPGLAGLGCNSS